MFSQIGPLEIVVVLVIVLLIFGPKRLPQLGRQMGRGMREFKDSVTGDRDDGDDRALDAAPEDREPAAKQAAEPAKEPVAAEGSAREHDAADGEPRS